MDAKSRFPDANNGPHRILNELTSMSAVRTGLTGAEFIRQEISENTFWRDLLLFQATPFACCTQLIFI